MAAKICTSCGYVGQSRSYAGGSTAVEILLWLFILIPGLIYSVWRATSKNQGCPKCKGRMIAAKTPNGLRYLKENGIKIKAFSFTGENADHSLVGVFFTCFWVVAIFVIFNFGNSGGIKQSTSAQSVSTPQSSAQIMNQAVSVKLAGYNPETGQAILTVSNNGTSGLSAIGGRLQFTANDRANIAILDISTSCDVAPGATTFVKAKANGNADGLSGKTSSDYKATWQAVEYYFTNGQKLKL